MRCVWSGGIVGSRAGGSPIRESVVEVGNHLEECLGCGRNFREGNVDPLRVGVDVLGELGRGG